MVTLRAFFFLESLIWKERPSFCTGSADLRAAAVVSFTPLSTATVLLGRSTKKGCSLMASSSRSVRDLVRGGSVSARERLARL